jgi:lactate permease
MILFWLSPFALFLGLILLGRTALFAGVAGTLAAGFVTWHSGPSQSDLPRIFDSFLGGIWIALPAVLVILAGLAFAISIEKADPDRSASTPNHGKVAQICLLTGPFMETATGFGVGYVFAIIGLRRLGVGSVHALALAAFSQALVPWGALGIGTRISSAIAGVEIEEIGWRIAVIMVPVWLALIPLFWRIAGLAGFAASLRDRIFWSALCSLLILLLVASNYILPIELSAIAALGVAMLARLVFDQGLATLDRKFFTSLTPFFSLIAALAAMQLWPALRSFLSTPGLQPFAELPTFSPLLSPALPLLVIAIVTQFNRSGLKGLAHLVTLVTSRGWRPGLLTFLLVGMAWILVRGGIAFNLMTSASQTLEIWAVGLVPLAGAAGGYLTGSNTGAGALSMPLANSVSLSMNARYFVVAAAIVAGSLLTAVSPVRFAMGLALSEAGQPQAKAALGLLMPFVLVVLFLTAIIAMAAAIAL